MVVGSRHTVNIAIEKQLIITCLSIEFSGPCFEYYGKVLSSGYYIDRALQWFG